MLYMGENMLKQTWICLFSCFIFDIAVPHVHMQTDKHPSLGWQKRNQEKKQNPTEIITCSLQQKSQY